jgi:hypothetical protein
VPFDKHTIGLVIAALRAGDGGRLIRLHLVHLDGPGGPAVRMAGRPV